MVVRPTTRIVLVELAHEGHGARQGNEHVTLYRQRGIGLQRYPGHLVGIIAQIHFGRACAGEDFLRENLALDDGLFFRRKSGCDDPIVR